MIAGMKAHAGGAALARHLSRTDHNEVVLVSTRGLASDDMDSAIEELGFLATGCRTAAPLIHVWISPPQEYSEEELEPYWQGFEAEFGLETQPYVQAVHRKRGEGGRAASHGHRAYSRVKPDRTAISLSHSYRRLEKLSRLWELAKGEPLVRGAHNRAVVSQLRREGRDREAQALENAGLMRGGRPIAVSPSERASAERLGDIAADEVWRRAYQAWISADTGAAFVAALSAANLRVAQGDREPVLIGPSGNVIGLRRAVANGARRANGPSIRKADLAKRLDGLQLPPLSVVLDGAKGRSEPLFAITGLDRSVPLPTAPQLAEMSEAGSADIPQDRDTDGPGDLQKPPLALTAEQIAAYLEFEAALAETAAQFAHEMRLQIEAEVEKAAQLRKRVARLGADPSLPAIGTPRWQDRFKSELAGLSPKVGSVLKWVERQEGGCQRLVLESGTTIWTAPDRAVASACSCDTVEVMIDYAVNQGWTGIVITGGTPAWRELMVRAAVRAALRVENEELQDIERDEQKAVDRDRAMKI